MHQSSRSWLGRRVLVTGGDGFIGACLVERLCALGADVRSLSRDAARPAPVCHTRVVGDVTLPHRLGDALDGCDTIFHCAATGGGTLANARAVNVEGTRNVLRASLDAGVEHIVHVSSIAVHATPLPESVDERQPLVNSAAAGAYAVSKAEAEHVVSEFPRATIVRPTCVYGPGSPTWVLAPLARVRDQHIRLVDGGRGLINLIYVDDLVDLLLLAADSPGEVFIANAYATRWADYLGAFGAMLRMPPPATVSANTAAAVARAGQWHFRFTRRRAALLESDIAQQTNRTRFENRKAREALGWSPRFDLAAGMRETEAWLRASAYLPRLRSLELGA